MMQTNQALLRWAIGAILISLLLGFAIYWAASLSAQGGLSSSQTGIGVDPLTAAEAELALAAATEQDDHSLQQAAPANAEQDPAQPPKQAVLLIERQPADKKSGGGQAREGAVYVYDYSTDELIHSVVDVATGALIEQERVQNVQLPLTEGEEARAIALAWEDGPTRQVLDEQFVLVTGQTLQSLDQLRIKATILVAESLPGRLNEAAQACGVQRCAQLLLFSVDNVAFEMLPVVSLSQEKVLQVQLLEVRE